ncbi:uncharacterized protein MELLADRAFT_94929 [Melampsora larici-populina 98AG31]|uniref:Uncharacterized protein n=1 Tax=Melampsora larici-populina (strain 98AG31 / pathotype 3-4-7) TaxID=747676 RepID=F4S8G6_MELLP|nr:uncharacterized protein MELLADRAFT_94929 [Melampsora larici-populina 98AG31]EGF99089.1 hypothetical protein MELLADRAFT_94929 [Melampsora larici-populina 98AG31]
MTGERGLDGSLTVKLGFCPALSTISVQHKVAILPIIFLAALLNHSIDRTKASTSTPNFNNTGTGILAVTHQDQPVAARLEAAVELRVISSRSWSQVARITESGHALFAPTEHQHLSTTGPIKCPRGSATADPLNTRSKAGTNKMQAGKRGNSRRTLVNTAGIQMASTQESRGSTRAQSAEEDISQVLGSVPNHPTITKGSRVDKLKVMNPPEAASTGMSPRAMSLGVEGDDNDMQDSRSIHYRRAASVDHRRKKATGPDLSGSLKASATEATGDDKRGKQASEDSGRHRSNSKVEDKQAPAEEAPSPPAVQEDQDDQVSLQTRP